MGTNYASLIADLFLFVMRGTFANLNTSTLNMSTDMFNDYDTIGWK